MKVAGIDPGLKGAVALLAGGVCTTHDMPVHYLHRNGKNRGEIDAHGLANLLWRLGAEQIYIELVTPMPANGDPDSTGRRRQQGTASAFAFGKGFGIIIGIVAAMQIPMTLVAARKWKSALCVPAAKDGARRRASELLPTASDQWPLVKNDGRAEAALLALYGARHGEFTPPLALA